MPKQLSDAYVDMKVSSDLIKLNLDEVSRTILWLFYINAGYVMFLLSSNDPLSLFGRLVDKRSSSIIYCLTVVFCLAHVLRCLSAIRAIVYHNNDPAVCALIRMHPALGNPFTKSGADNAGFIIKVLSSYVAFIAAASGRFLFFALTALSAIIVNHLSDTAPIEERALRLFFLIILVLVLPLMISVSFQVINHIETEIATADVPERKFNLLAMYLLILFIYLFWYLF